MGQNWETVHRMKVFICISALLAACSAQIGGFGGAHGGPGGLGHHGGPGVGHGGLGHAGGHGGHGIGHGCHGIGHGYGHDIHEIIPYHYNYAVADSYTGARFDQEEHSNGAGTREGHYSVNLPDGRIQHVNYHTNDHEGYVAEVTYQGHHGAIGGHGGHGGIGGHGGHGGHP